MLISPWGMRKSKENVILSEWSISQNGLSVLSRYMRMNYPIFFESMLSAYMLCHSFQVLMCKYHSVFVSSAGHVYTCGHGRGGRLGHGNEETILVCTLAISLCRKGSMWYLISVEYFIVKNSRHLKGLMPWQRRSASKFLLPMTTLLCSWKSKLFNS